MKTIHKPLALLQWVKELPYATDYTEAPVLMYPLDEAGIDAVTWARHWSGEDYVYAGFPGTQGTGSYFMDAPIPKPAMTAAGQHKDAVWQYLRSLLLVPRAGVDLLPVTRAGFEEAMTDLVGQEMDWGPDGKFVCTQADADKLRALVYGTDKFARDDPALYAIISTQAQAYFSGQRSLEDAVTQIQRRASLYVAEQA